MPSHNATYSFQLRVHGLPFYGNLEEVIYRVCALLVSQSLLEPFCLMTLSKMTKDLHVTQASVNVQFSFQEYLREFLFLT